MAPRTHNRDSVTLSEALLDYYEIREARYSPSTWEAHVGQLERLRTWLARELGSNIHLTDIDERTMVRYFNRLRPPVLAGSSFNNYRQYARMFFAFCRGEGWIERDPMRHVDPAPVIRKVRLMLSATELLAMLDGASPRDRVALALGMHTALRASDTLALTVGSINLTNDLITAYIHKTKKWQELPLSAELRNELIRWFQVYAQACGVERWEDLPNEWPLVPGERWQLVNLHRPELGGRKVYTPLEPRRPVAEQIVHKALERIGHNDTKGTGFHTLRASAARCAKDLADADGEPDSLGMVQAWLGHKHRSTTEIYTGLTHDKQRLDAMLRGKSFLHRVAGADQKRHDDGESGKLARVGT